MLFYGKIIQIKGCDIKMPDELKESMKTLLIQTAITTIITLIFIGVGEAILSYADNLIVSLVVVGIIIVPLFTCILLYGKILFIVLTFLIEKVALRKANKEYRKRKLTKIDKVEYENYYRDILNINSPLVISFIDDFKITKTDLVAELFHLEKKK